MRSLLWRAGCAGAFMRRTEQLLEPARWLTAAKDDLQLLHQDQRLEKIAEIPDPYRRLNGVLARLSAGAAPAEQLNAGVLRRLPRTLSSDVSSPAARGALAAPSPSGSDSLVQSLRRDVSASALASAPLPGPQRGSLTPVTPGPAAAASDGRNAEDAWPEEQGSGIAPASARSVPAAPWQSPGAAAREWEQRLNDAVTRRAFQTPVRVDGHANSPAISQSLAAMTNARPALSPPEPQQRADDAWSSDARAGGATAFAVERDIPNLEPPGNAPQRRPLEWPSIASTGARAIADSPRPASGLRRLAALATEPLNDPEPASLSNVASPSAVATGEEFERVLRREAERHGIDLEGAVR